MTIGDKATVEINAENAYGPHQTDAIQTVDRSMIPQEVDLTVGSQLQATTPDDQTLLLTVAATRQLRSTAIIPWRARILPSTSNSSGSWRRPDSFAIA
jgi:hypothetical protein